jgi:Ser/Thr protein kinase RdoA (MazF antagonist)
LIHADPVRENVLIDENHVQLIDFDDGGYGFRLFDLATVLLKCRSEPDFSMLSEKMQAGYHSIRELDVTHLQFMIALRAFTYVGWIIPRRDESWAPARLERFKIDALHFAAEVITSPHDAGPK